MMLWALWAVFDEGVDSARSAYPRDEFGDDAASS